jgi:hypothetical protein
MPQTNHPPYPPSSINTDDTNVKIGEDDFQWKSGKGSEENIKGIILAHIRKISELSCQEMTPSYFTRKPVKVGEGVLITEIYHPDLRLAYCNAVDFLQDMLMPNADKEFREWMKALIIVEDKEFKLYMEKGLSQDTWIWKKLEFRRKIFAELMLMIQRSDFFGEEVYVE